MSQKPFDTDQHYMRHALRLAERGLGNTWPNPSVGAVVVKDGVIIGRGRTAKGGRPHAEVIALAEAGEDAHGATIYVTLEPCSHHGKAPPCMEAIIKSGIKRVVAACTDSNPLVAGKGFEGLRSAGIEVIENVYEKEALTLNEGFFSRINRGRPFVTLKIATSLDGKITTGTKDKSITSENSRDVVHLMRANHDAILTGIGTVLEDNPALTCRIAGRESDSPQRIVLDSSLRIPPTAAVLPAWIFTSEEAHNYYSYTSTRHSRAGGNLGQDPRLHGGDNLIKLLAEKNCRIFSVAKHGGHLSLDAVLKTLADEGITRLMVEAGSALNSAFIEQGLADHIYWFRAPTIIGKKGLNAIHESLSLSQSLRYSLKSAERIGDDTLEIYNNRLLS